MYIIRHYRRSYDFVVFVFVFVFVLLFLLLFVCVFEVADMCLVFEVLGETLLHWIKRYHYRGLPMKMVQSIARQCLTALAFLHEDCKIIHTDLKYGGFCLHTLPLMQLTHRV